MTDRPSESEVDPAALAVHSIDDQTRTHLRDPDETEDAEAGSGVLTPVDEADQAEEAESDGTDASRSADDPGEQ